MNFCSYRKKFDRNTVHVFYFLNIALVFQDQIGFLNVVLEKDKRSHTADQVF